MRSELQAKPYGEFDSGRVGRACNCTMQHDSVATKQTAIRFLISHKAAFLLPLRGLGLTPQIKHALFQHQSPSPGRDSFNPEMRRRSTVCTRAAAVIRRIQPQSNSIRQTRDHLNKKSATHVKHALTRRGSSRRRGLPFPTLSLQPSNSAPRILIKAEELQIRLGVGRWRVQFQV